MSFFGTNEVLLEGTGAYTLGHSMASVSGYGIFGSYAYHDELRKRLLEVGSE